LFEEDESDPYLSDVPWHGACARTAWKLKAPPKPAGHLRRVNPSQWSVQQCASAVEASWADDRFALLRALEGS
jgi:hypothetical protein